MSNTHPPHPSASRRARRALVALVALVLAVVLCPPASAESDPPATPEQALRDYYQAINDGDCSRAMALRPGYRRDSCRAIAAVRLHQVEPLRQGNERAALRLSLTLVDADGERRFDGLVGLRRCADRQWRIISASFAGIDQVDAIRYGDDIVAGRRESGQTCAATSEPERGPGDPGTTPTPVAPRPLHGSALLLKRCWDAAELAAREGEDQIRPSDPSVEPKPPTLPPEAAGWVLDDPPPPFANIRRVELADGDRAIALTFNLIERPGEIAGYDAELVELLRRNRIPATFFASGRWLLSHRERALQLLADPLFELASLGWDHRNLAVASAAAAEQDLLYAEAAQRSLRAELARRGCTADEAGRQAMHLIATAPRLYRMPYGRCDDRRRALTAVAAIGAQTVQWSLVLDDIAADADSTHVLKRARDGLTQTGPGTILVGHADGRGRHTAAALRELLLHIERHDYEPVTVSALLLRGKPTRHSVCFEHREGDNRRYDTRFPD